MLFDILRYKYRYNFCLIILSLSQYLKDVSKLFFL